MKNKKIILGLSTLLALSGLAMSCGKKDNRTPEEKVEEVLNSLVYDGLDSCTTDITLIYEIPDVKGVEITYQASSSVNEIVESNWLKISDDHSKALVTRPAKGSTQRGYELAYLHANIKCESAEENTVFAVKVMEGGVDKTIGDVLKTTSADKDNIVTVKGYVTAVGSGCCFIADKTGAILIYSSSAVTDIAVGDSVQAEGSLSFYQGVPQFAYNATTPVTVTKLDETVDYTPTAATVWDGAKVSEYMDYTTADKLLGNHVTVTGTLTIESSKYYNITVPGVTKGNGAAICYPSDTMKETLANLDGKAIKVTGYTLYISHDYMYIIAESVEEATITDDEKFEAAVSAVTVNSEIYDTVTLDSTSLYDSTVTWTSDNAAITIGEDGHTATVTQGSADVTVKLTATITMGSKTTTKEFTVTVKAKQLYAHAGTEADPFTVADAIMKAKEAGETATSEQYYIKGVIKSVNDSGVASYGNINVVMIDEGNENDEFTAFQVYYQGNKFTAETAALVTVGSTIVVKGAILNYKGNTPETNGKGSSSIMSIQAGAPVAATGINADASLEVKVGKTAKINATVEPSNATDKALTFTSNNPSMATVDENGVVTGVATGETVIFVALKSNSDIKTTVNVTVVEAGEEPVTGSTVTLDVTSLGLKSQSYADGTATVDGVDFSFTELGNYGSGIQLRNKNGKISTFKNTTAFAKAITKIEFTYNEAKATFSNTDALSIEFSNSSDFAEVETQKLSTVKGQTAYEITPEANTYTYVRFTILITYSMYFDSIVIHLAD